MVSMEPEEYMPRLSFIHYLYNTAIEKSKEPEPKSASSILLLHDSVELLLNLVSEFFGVPVSKEFMGYWKQLGVKIPAIVGHQISMGKFNKIRVGLKHNGIIPNSIEIESSCVNVASFMETITFEVFKTEFAKISMVDLIDNNTVRSKLLEARTNMDRNEISKAALNLAIAFEQLIYDSEKQQQQRQVKSPFNFGDLFVASSIKYQTDEEHKHIVDSIISLQDSVKIMALGIDYQKYHKFRSLTPQVSIDSNGEWHPSLYYSAILENHVDPQQYILPTQAECQFCFDFVIETAIKLQNLIHHN